ncbi:Calx-beta domain-containing protein [Paenibacillus solisilvae]|uniref:Calx-beta domain-containing protein n=1 Tax=Paenibacillus solisilvae TaxID=2486751 RepID=A0ABW0VZ77_9BACL
MEDVVVMQKLKMRIFCLLACLLAVTLLIPGFQLEAHAAGQSEISFETNFVSVKESAGTVKLKVFRTNGAGTAKVVYFANGGGLWLTFAPGETSKTISFPLKDDTVAQGNRLLKVYFVTSYIEGAVFGPNTSVNVEVLDDDGGPIGPGKIQFGSPNIKVQENAGAASLIVQRRGGTTGEVTVNYKTHADYYQGAKDGVDYEGVSGTLVFADGESLKTIKVPIIDNDNYDHNRTFYLSLTNPAGGANLGEIRDQYVQITNDDPITNGIRFAPGDVQVNENQGYAAIDVLRDQPSGAATVSYATSKYNHRGTVRFEEGETKKTIQIPIIDDGIPEANEILIVSLSIVSGEKYAYLSSPSTVRIEIVDNDTAHFEFKSKTNYAMEETGMAYITVIRSGTSKGRVSVGYTTAPVSAKDGSNPSNGIDFIQMKGTLTFDVGETVKNIQIPLVDDSIREYNEKFRIHFTPNAWIDNITVGTFTEVVILDQDHLTNS